MASKKITVPEGLVSGKTERYFKPGALDECYGHFTTINDTVNGDYGVLVYIPAVFLSEITVKSYEKQDAILIRNYNNIVKSVKRELKAQKGA